MIQGLDENARLRGADRMLQMEQLRRFGDQISWLSDPDGVGEQALGPSMHGGSLGQQCMYLANNMLVEVVDWSAATERGLPWAETFERYELSNPGRVALRSRYRDSVEKHAPGIRAMAEHVIAATYVAARGGAPQEAWEPVAANSRHLGNKMSRGGTTLQMVVRKYLWGKDSVDVGNGTVALWDPAKLKLDAQTGITTVNPIDDLVRTTRARLDAIYPSDARRYGSGVCRALQVGSLVPQEGTLTIYDDFWLAYTAVVARLVHPRHDIPAGTVPTQRKPDNNRRLVAKLDAHIRSIKASREPEII
jgi:hypothetical protein